ncbi:hypothetical protein VN97_g7517 [Penicillium thymicola]|uniref:Uncharacterized protein n=1 Tax=Penicillium thymicola TaxID=293382 RepID=A0AAI9X6G4_PENTH|nr:hypothetical protein VN97_g7517 [Penicillium thymicola]
MCSLLCSVVLVRHANEMALTDDFLRQVAKRKKAERPDNPDEAEKKEKKRWKLLTSAFDFSAPATNEDEDSEGPTSLPILHIIVKESGVSTVGAEKEEDFNGEDVRIRWVRVPRGYRLPPKSKKANVLAEVVDALQGSK